MARRGILDYVLGGAVGGLEGLAQQRAAEDEKKRMADALARQQGIDAMDRARFLMQSNFRIAPEAYTTEDPAARSVLPPLEMPSAAPSSGARASGALSAALNRGMGVDATQPSMSRPGFGAKPLAMDSGTTRMTEMFERAAPTRPAQEAIAASVDLPGGMKMRFNAPETAAQITARTMADYEAKKKADAAIAAQAKAEEAQRVAEAKSAEMTDAEAAWIGAGLSPAKAKVAARTGAKYGDVYMSDKDLQSLGISRDQLKLAQDRFKFDQEKANATSPANEIEKRLPVGARNDIADYNAAIRTLQEAQKEVANNPGAFGIRPVLYAKGGILGRSMREKSEGEKSEAYTKARAQMQSALMKLRKTQFGTQMTKLEKDTGEEVFPSGAESEKRLTQMLSVLVGNAEQLRRGVYEANNAPDLYTPIAPDTQTTTPTPPAAKPAIAGSGGRKPALTIDQWMDANPQRAGESDEAYMARARTSREGK
jgi:hypothetical protein